MGSRTEEGSPTDPGCTGAVRLLVWAVDSSRVMGCLEPGAVTGEMSQPLDTGAKPSIS